MTASANTAGDSVIASDAEADAEARPNGAGGGSAMTVVGAIRRFVARLIGVGPEDRCPVTGRAHDYSNSVEGRPWHFVELECRSCGGKFTI